MYDAKQLRKLATLAGIAVPESDETLMYCLGTVLNSVARHIESMNTAIPPGWKVVMVPREAPSDKPDYAECERQACVVTGLPAPDPHWLSIYRREINRFLIHQSAWRKNPPDEQGCWWWWNEDGPPIVVNIGVSLTGNRRYFAEQGQHGWNRSQWVEDMGGLWMTLSEPPLPESV